MFDFLTDQNLLSALAAMIGPLAFFAAPTEEIEYLLFSDTAEIASEATFEPDLMPIGVSVAEAA